MMVRLVSTLAGPLFRLRSGTGANPPKSVDGPALGAARAPASASIALCALICPIAEDGCIPELEDAAGVRPSYVRYNPAEADVCPAVLSVVLAVVSGTDVRISKGIC